MSDHHLSQAAAATPARPSFFDRWFRPVSVPREAAGDLDELARRGSIVFVMRSAGLLNYLYLAWLLRRLGAPPLRSALGLKGFLPWLAGVRRTQAALEEALVRGETSLVFLRRASGPDPFPILAAAQRKLGRPVFLVPALLVWTRRPQKLKPSLGEILFGTPDVPSRFANGIGFLLNRRRAVLRLGRPSDLSTFVSERTAESDAVLGRKARGALHHHLAREVRSVVGPPLKTPDRMREQVMRDKGLRRALEREAVVTGRPMASLVTEAERDVREIASRYSPAFVEIARPILGWVLRRLYDSIEVDETGLARVRRAAGDAPIVLCPSHKSHVDYLVLSYVFSENGMTPPHVAAGINLAFWPFGAIARAGGAFFIRRTLRGNRVYTAALRAYVKQLLRDRFPQEFYLEGGRSRTGKLLSPKTGLFSMEVDAWLEQASEDVLFVPVAVDYERLIEGSSYVQELAGGEKKKEDFRGLLRARKVLGGRYGRLTIQFEEPVSLRAFAAERLGDGAGALRLDEVMVSPDAPAGAGSAEVADAASGRPGESEAASSKRQLVQALANRVAFGINNAITITPVGLLAAALLAPVRRGVSADEVARRVELLRAIASARRARFSRGFAVAPSDPRQPGALAEAVARLAGDGLVQVEQAAGETLYRVTEEKRPLLDYHKNAIIHRFVPIALIAAALRASGGDGSIEEVKGRTRWLSRLFKLEFLYQVGDGFDAIFAGNAQFLAGLGLVDLSPARLRALRLPALDFLADLLRPFLEAYGVTASALLAADRAEPGAPIERRALVKSAMERARVEHAAGRVALRETLSKALFENAVEWLSQQGALELVEGRSRLSPAWRDETLPAMIREIEGALSSSRPIDLDVAGGAASG